MCLIAAIIHLTLVNLLMTLCNALKMHAYGSCPGHVSLYVKDSKCECAINFIQYIETYCSTCHKSNNELATICQVCNNQNIDRSTGVYSATAAIVSTHPAHPEKTWHA
ncbi:uncharacterized protein PGTG_03547 [Puccinia graminis f. sp. tritici CRL 75-36-700-3]|uniref:Uncharacterized protein n=1 Tax=Puccinia graminis f. sp. tritici (strain CRL 75-36-700-3 / race SCCL) TaxID=418459 RepID=E3JZW6_PUCGT|nr:uncharacterized protein PGTG_03547 [Puccinia graminis f. sp. tritici CRL 75-36-700-3]EFP77591.1 hypothetical protein PGTG_03547 [Puccinia graminis f. sp. tritici CRL 75-36-700-3]